MVDLYFGRGHAVRALGWEPPRWARLAGRVSPLPNFRGHRFTLSTYGLLITVPTLAFVVELAAVDRQNGSRWIHGRPPGLRGVSDKWSA